MFESQLSSISNAKLRRTVDIVLIWVSWLVACCFLIFVENPLWWFIVTAALCGLGYFAYRGKLSWCRPLTYAACISGVWLLWYLIVIFNVAGLNTYSEGWRAGNLADYGFSNRMLQGYVPPGWLFPTGEGYILLGDASSKGASLDGRIISPSAFSTSYALFVKDNALIKQPVAMRFRVLRHRWFLNGATDVRVSQFEKQVPATLPADCAKPIGNALGSRFNGVIGGKVVQAARVMVFTPLIRTNEVIIHTGGNEFKEMSVTNDHIFQCAVQALKTGEQMRISYENQLFRNPLTQNTNYNLIAIAN